MELEVVEPFRHLFKDEVRKMAREKLGMGDELVYRHPSPGPGLAIRIMGDVTSEKLDILRRADFILNDEIRERGLYREIDQAFAGLSSNKTTGVMGDEGTYEGEIRIRTICSNDFMTADVFRYEWDDLQAISNRIVSEIKGVNRVSYDISQKPPATIEWE
ncbi:hypothetical protein CMI42_04260 [Candidatus Pacearchaeota archaeon]|nr:hypothetical protein [Candidatus Pacearchaeota archaeon]